MLGHDPAPYRDPEGNERWILLGAFLFGLAACAAIVIEDYQPVKLAPVFVMLAWFPLIALHELGHAAVAKLVGWDVEEMVVGFGPAAHRFEVLGVPVTLKTYPLGGWVRPVPRDLSAVRLKSALVYAAGPSVELAVVAVLLGAFGVDAMLTRTDAVPVIAAQAVSIAALLGAASNLVPRGVDTEHGRSVTDGMGILSSFRRGPETYVAQVRDGWERRIEDRSLLGDVDGTIAACEAAFDALGEDAHLRAAMNAALERLDAAAVGAAADGRRLPEKVRARVAEEFDKCAENRRDLGALEG